VVITPSHNPAEDGGFKYNPPEGGPADTTITQWIQDRANALLADGLRGVRRMTLRRALAAETTQERDYITPYVADLAAVVDMDAIAAAGLRIGVDPMGGSGVHYWAPIAERYKLNLEVVNPYVDPTFGFMTVDHDGKIRMDCSSPYAMASLIRLKDDFDIAFGNDPDFDRHGIVTRSAGLMNPNHFLAVAIWYLFQNRPAWRADAAVGKTLVSSSMIDRVAAHWAGGWPKCRSASSGLSMGCSAASTASAARRAPGRHSCVGRHGVDDRQGWLHHGLAGGRDHGPHRARPRRAVPRAGRALRRPGLRAGRHARCPRRARRCWAS
jgi:hypothetical protein